MAFTNRRSDASTDRKRPRQRPAQSTGGVGEPPPYRPQPELLVSEMNLFQKLAVLQEWVGGMKKSGHYSHGSTDYWYHKHEDIVDALRPRLSALGIDATVEIPESETIAVKGRMDSETGVAKEGFRSVITLKITLTNADYAHSPNAESQQSYSLRMAGLDFGDKDHTKAGTLALKYFWVWKLGLGDAESDADRSNTEPETGGVTTGSPSAGPSTAAPEGVEIAEWDALGSLAQRVGWGPKKTKARIIHHGGEREGYLKTLGELMDEFRAKFPSEDPLKVLDPVQPSLV